MNFHPAQIAQLIARAPLMQLLNPSTLDRLLDRTIQDCLELGAMLSKYPIVLYEPLEPIYRSLEFQGIRNPKVVSDLCDPMFGWRGIVVAAWIACLAPTNEFCRYLHAAKTRAPRNQWLADLAVAESQNADQREFTFQQTRLRELRKILDTLPKPQIKLREAMNSERFEIASKTLSEIYKYKGSSEALFYATTQGLVPEPISFHFGS
jgi:hypothetical protein